MTSHRPWSPRFTTIVSILAVGALVGICLGLGGAVAFALSYIPA